MILYPNNFVTNHRPTNRGELARPARPSGVSAAFGVRRSPSRPRRRGFTLIELLVVVSIITLLISITLPVLGKARESARTVTCLSNLKQIGIAHEIYKVDHNFYMPPTRTDSRTWTAPDGPVYSDHFDGFEHPATTSISYADVLIQQANTSAENFRCASQTDISPTMSAAPTGRAIGYAANWLIANPLGGVNPSHLLGTAMEGSASVNPELSKFGPYKFDLITAPSRGLYLTDSPAHDQTPTTNAFVYVFPTAFTAGKAARHADGRVANVLYFDGHARTEQANRIGDTDYNSPVTQPDRLWRPWEID